MKVDKKIKIVDHFKQHCCDTNIKQCDSSKILNLTNIMRPYAPDSELQHNHVAVLINNKTKTIVDIACNTLDNRICGYTVPSGHAEACVLNHLYGRRRRFKGWFKGY